MCQFLLCIYHLLYHLLYHLKNILLHALYCLELNITRKRHCTPSCRCFSSFFHFMFSLNSWVSCYCRCNWITLCCTFIIIKIIYKSCTSNNSIKFDFTIEGLCYMEKNIYIMTLSDINLNKFLSKIVKPIHYLGKELLNRYQHNIVCWSFSLLER